MAEHQESTYGPTADGRDYPTLVVDVHERQTRTQILADLAALSPDRWVAMAYADYRQALAKVGPDLPPAARDRLPAVDKAATTLCQEAFLVAVRLGVRLGRALAHSPRVSLAYDERQLCEACRGYGVQSDETLSPSLAMRGQEPVPGLPAPACQACAGQGWVYNKDMGPFLIFDGEEDS